MTSSISSFAFVVIGVASIVAVDCITILPAQGTTPVLPRLDGCYSASIPHITDTKIYITASSVDPLHGGLGFSALSSSETGGDSSGMVGIAVVYAMSSTHMPWHCPFEHYKVPFPGANNTAVPFTVLNASTSPTNCVFGALALANLDPTTFRLAIAADSNSLEMHVTNNDKVEDVVSLDFLDIHSCVVPKPRPFLGTPYNGTMTFPKESFPTKDDVTISVNFGNHEVIYNLIYGWLNIKVATTDATASCDGVYWQLDYPLVDDNIVLSDMPNPDLCISKLMAFIGLDPTHFGLGIYSAFGQGTAVVRYAEVGSSVVHRAELRA